jgi:hypothetical protein
MRVEISRGHQPRLQQRWWRCVLWAGVLALLPAWQAANTGALLAADEIALSEAWRFVDESKPGAPATTGDLAAAAAGAPSPVAATFNISSTMQALALQLHDGDLAGLRLATVNEMRYCTHLVDGPRPYAVTLQLNIDANLNDGDHSWQGRLVYTPSHNGAVIQGEWQCWNTLTGKWWATGGPVAAYAPEENPQPLGTLLARFPNLGIHKSYSGVALKAGDGWSDFRGEASPVVINVEGERIAIAFGALPQGETLDSDGFGNDNFDNEVLLPVVFNEPQVSTQKNKQNDNKANKNRNKDKQVDNTRNEDKNDDRNRDKKDDGPWRAVEWDDLNWAGIDWENIDWDKVDWDFIDWGAFGWPDGRAEAVRAFVEDVEQCENGSWEEMGFSNAGNCVAYYVQQHTPSDLEWKDLNWENSEWVRSWYDRKDRNRRDWRDGRD